MAKASTSGASESYGAFAYAYDAALGGHFFAAVRPLLSDALAKYPPRTKTHLDIACGTGIAMEFFAKRGFRSVGVDASLPMLQMARRRVAQWRAAALGGPNEVHPERAAEGSGPPLVAADFRALPLRGTFARITCLYDSLNHMKTRDDLVAAFASIRTVMDAESLFLFDMNHPDIYPAVWGMRDPYISSGADHHLEIATRFRRREGIGYGLVTGWAKLPDGSRVEIRETHEQRSWSEDRIVDALGEAGMVPVEVRDFDPFSEIDTVDAQGVKLFFVCRAV